MVYFRHKLSDGSFCGVKAWRSVDREQEGEVYALKYLTAAFVVELALAAPAIAAGSYWAHFPDGTLLKNPGGEDGTLGPWTVGGSGPTNSNNYTFDMVIDASGSSTSIVGPNVYVPPPALDATEPTHWFRVDIGMDLAKWQTQDQVKVTLSQLIEIPAGNANLGGVVSYGGDSGASAKMASGTGNYYILDSTSYKVEFLNSASIVIGSDTPPSTGSATNPYPYYHLTYRRNNVSVPAYTAFIRLTATATAWFNSGDVSSPKQIYWVFLFDNFYFDATLRYPSNVMLPFGAKLSGPPRAHRWWCPRDAKKLPRP